MILAALPTFASKYIGTTDIAPMHFVIDLAPGGYVKNGSVSTGPLYEPETDKVFNDEIKKIS